MAWAEKKKDYDKQYVKNRQVRCYPPPRDLAFIRGLQAQTGMGESETVRYLIQVAHEKLAPQKVAKFKP